VPSTGGTTRGHERTRTDEHGLTEVVARLRRALRASIRTDYPWESLPMAQVEVLQSLAEHSPVRAGDLSERLRLAPSTVSGLLSQMIASGLVERGTDPYDRRVAVVVLSDAGRAQLAAWHDAHHRRIAAALDALAPSERTAIDNALPALAQLTERLTADSHEA
jgi:DNA-binding MarR family transcriptional regulator